MKKKLLNACFICIFLAFASCSTNEQEPFPADITPESSVDNANVMDRKFDSEKVNIFKGPQVQFGDGKLRSFVTLTKERIPVEIGIIMTPEVLDNLEILPPEEILTVLPLHQKAKEVTPFEHLGVKYSLGHPPAFFAKHFDFYFFMISSEERMTIPEYSPATAPAVTLFPPDGYMPYDYGTPPGQGGFYPEVGKHWLPLNLPAYLPFTSIMVQGTYNGEFIFVEPMATVDFLLSNPDFSSPYSQPDLFQESSHYPTQYNIYVDSKTQDIYVTLTNFVAR